MAILNKPDIQVLIDAYTVKVDSVIVANGVGAITGPILNDVLQDSIEILTDIKDSYYNLLSETRTALSTTYDNTATNSLWTAPAPTEAQGAIDKLITSVSTNPSQTIAHVATNGSDTIGEYEVGNPLKPFATFLVAWNAMPPSNFIIKSLGGSFDVGVLLILQNKSNFTIDLSGTTINGTEFRLTNCIDGFINLEGGTINALVKLGIVGGGITGGNINNQLLLSGMCFVDYVEISTTSLIALNITQASLTERPFISNCKIISTANTAVSVSSARFSNCYMEGDVTAFSNSSLSTVLSKLDNCTIVGKGNVGFGFPVISGGSGVLNGIFKNCTIKSTVGVVMRMGNASFNVFFENCDIIAETDCVYLLSNLNRPLINNKSTFKRCSFYTNSGEIFFQQGTFTNPTDLGVTSLIGTTFTNKALKAIGTYPDLEKFEVLGDQITDVNAQIPPL